MSNRCVNKKYHYLYKTTNLVNSKYYYGIHSTNNLNDGYLGSGSYLRNAIHKHGKDNFKREIIEMFDKREDLANAEKKLLTKEIIQDKYCMNLMFGGEKFNTLGMVTAKDKDGNTMKVFCDDDKYLSGELVSISKGKVMVKDNNGTIYQVDNDDVNYLSNDLVSTLTNMVMVKDENGNILQIDKNDDRYSSGELVSMFKGTTLLRDTNGNLTRKSINDEGFLSGELFGLFKGKKHTKESKDKMSERAKERVGDKNSQYGTCWITKNGENKKIKKEDIELYISIGWIKGRKI